MPQFNLANWLPQIAWLILMFGAMYVVVRASLPKVNAVAASRSKLIGDDLAQAEAAKSRAQAMVAEYEATLTAARTAAGKVTGDTKAEVAGQTAAQLKIVDAGLAEKAEAAQKVIADARTAAMANLQTVAADATADIVERLTGRRPAEAAATAAVAAAAA